MTTGSPRQSPAAGQGVFGISVAAEMVGMDPQSLRLYERRGLLTPSRTEGGTRLYSSDDIDRLRRIGVLLGSGVNIAGIEMVLGLEAANAELQIENDRLSEPNPRPLLRGSSTREH
jgi:DNA-binding transcriptional MerR regulator